jgi:hypothetical protein
MAYFATRISENISRTPEENFIIARSCVLGRTGFQRYQIRDLPREQAEKFGIDLSDQNAFIDLYRPAEEVFDPACIASFNGKPVCEGHPPQFVDAENSREFTRGHIQNVRRGDEPLESGEQPLLGDLIITDADLIARVEAGLRSLSLGYSYTLGKEGDKFTQTQIRGNHCAVVDKGRAGPEARINDAANATDDDPNPDQYAELQKLVDSKRGQYPGLAREQQPPPALGDFGEIDAQETRERGQRVLGGSLDRDMFRRDRNIHYASDHEVDRLLALEHMYAAARGRRGN